MKVNIRPLDDRVVVKQTEAQEVTAGGIVLPDSAKEKPQQGTIVAIGAGKMLESGKRGEMCVKVGDEIFYGKYAGSELEVDGEKFVILREGEILAVLNK
ncbi:MAG: co-chaperone GroES [Phycisphaerae bacterium]|nr:co-chaperone GroES [Phycisphaerae bacterium]